MKRHFENWLGAYCDYTKHLEAPTNIHFFAGVQAIAGALRRQVWFDQGYFTWHPNQYIIIVAKPGIANKSTSIGVAMDLLREIPGVNFGPSSMTWQALIQAMGDSTEQVEIAGEFHTQSCLSFVASELGTLIDFHNREMIDVLVDLWDGKTGAWEKMSKANGKEIIINPWISLIAGTTPSWLMANVPESAIGGGFTSRCLFVYGSTKRHLCAYPKSNFEADHWEMRQKLVEDLEHISSLKGGFRMEQETQAYGEAWYDKLWTDTPLHLRSPRYEAYLARKQTHVHKLAMIISASRRDTLEITMHDFVEAEGILTSIEDDMALALDKIGKTETAQIFDAIQEEIIKYGPRPYDEIMQSICRMSVNGDAKHVLDMAHLSGICTSKSVGGITMIDLPKDFKRKESKVLELHSSSSLKIR